MLERQGWKDTVGFGSFTHRLHRTPLSMKQFMPPAKPDVTGASAAYERHSGRPGYTFAASNAQTIICLQRDCDIEAFIALECDPNSNTSSIPLSFSLHDCLVLVHRTSGITRSQTSATLPHINSIRCSASYTTNNDNIEK